MICYDDGSFFSTSRAKKTALSRDRISPVEKDLKGIKNGLCMPTPAYTKELHESQTPSPLTTFLIFPDGDITMANDLGEKMIQRM
jgi:hypothetical protein